MPKTFWDHVRENLPNAPTPMHKAMWEYLLTFEGRLDPSVPHFQGRMDAYAEAFKAGWAAKVAHA